MTIEPETFRAELAEFLDRELPRQLADLPPITAEYWGGRRPELRHPSSKRYCELFSRSITIAGGTSEIQLNIIAKHVLALPD